MHAGMRVLKVHTIYLDTSASFTTENDCILIFDRIDSNIVDHNFDHVELYLLDADNPPVNKIHVHSIWPGIDGFNRLPPLCAAKATRFEIVLSFPNGHIPENFYVYEVA